MISKTGHHYSHQDSYNGDRRGRTPDVREVGERIDGATPLPKFVAISFWAHDKPRLMEVANDVLSRS